MKCSPRRHPKTDLPAALRGALLCALLWASGAAAAGSQVRAELDAFLGGLETYAAEFQQHLYDEYGELLESAEGTVAVARPGRFRWDYLSPYIQQIVTDGETLWVYDGDLAQVTVRPVADSATNSPAQLLGQDIDLDEHYDVTDEDPRDGLQWLRLTPKGNDDQYAGVHLGLAGGLIKGMRLTDNLGQTTEIRFTKVARNGSVDESQFTFVAPPGTDVVDGSAP